MVTSGFRCPRCGHPLDVAGFDRIWSPNGPGLSRYRSMLAIAPLKSLGEGATPLITVEKARLRVHLKLEYLNPSGSFKDRGTVLAISHASSVGVRCVVEDTSGNTGISVAMYSTTMGLQATIVMPRDAPEGKKRAVKLLGGEVLEAPSRGEATIMAQKLVAERRFYYVDHLASPLYIEGYRTIAYEIFECIGVPDAVVVPAGSCGLFIGTYRGFEDLYRLGYARRKPMMIAVQGVEVAPLYEKLYGEKPPSGTSKLTDGIRVPKPPRLEEAVSIIRETEGRVVLVSDEDIVSALRELLGMGLIVEPTSAAAYAALVKVADELRSMGIEDVVIPLTGSGLKMLEKLDELLR